MGIIIDIILVLIIVASTVIAFRRGLIRTVFSFVGAIVAIYLSIMLSNPVASLISTHFVSPAVKSYVISTVDKSAIGKSYEDIQIDKDYLSEEMQKMPDSLKASLDLAGIDPEDVLEKLESGVDVDKIIDDICSPISYAVSRVIALVVLFVVLSAALWVITRLLTVVFGLLPVGKSINKTGGAIFGVFRGLVIVFIISTLFSALMIGTDPNSNNIFSKKTVESTYILKTISDFNPINKALNIK